MFSAIIEVAVSLLIVVGAAFVLISAIGLVRLPDFFTRLHAPTKASTLGVGCLALASLLHFSSHQAGVSLHEILIAAFLFLTAPISAQLLAKTRWPDPADDA
ncbi:MAG: Na+/H+ antiporter subunit G [Candidatus Competibacter sp.]|nr:Na+/H+ antiporter subunit G [Candidatus Competibacter sp.]MDG4604573.1 Na+/H+ antiporter subunit G [Candidatus Contendobacter sp.]HRD49797.1 Na+/H+ antiporter subunit G [Candidatus Contendobacter sp.]